MLLDNDSHAAQVQREVDLIARLCVADEAALQLLYHHYYSRLFRFISRVTRQETLIDEVINDVMYVVWEKATTYNQQCKPSTWIFGIAYNKARQALRNQSNPEESLELLEEDSPIFGQLDQGLQQLEMDNWLEAAFEQLAPEQRAVIELTYFQGLHYTEIAVLMDCPENTVKTRMHYARKKLATLLNKDEHTASRRS
ncbi:MAG: sigma-70 family RNA polymerase sigma factor [Methylococcaceae bacterium]|nr:sigma-70 family RNA polymerase sigma factor [Methylococcaceae bacterium]